MPAGRRQVPRGVPSNSTTGRSRRPTFDRTTGGPNGVGRRDVPPPEARDIRSATPPLLRQRAEWSPQADCSSRSSSGSSALSSWSSAARARSAANVFAESKGEKPSHRPAQDLRVPRRLLLPIKQSPRAAAGSRVAAPVLAVLAELGGELGWGEDRQFAAEAEEVLVAGHEECVARDRKS